MLDLVLLGFTSICVVGLLAYTLDWRVRKSRTDVPIKQKVTTNGVHHSKIPVAHH